MDESIFPHSDNARSVKSDGDAMPDRRASDRHRAVCRIARVTRARDTGLWRVRNISDEGLQLAADVLVTVGETVEIALSETILVHGRIVWANSGRCGVAFKTKIDVGATLHALAAEQRAEGYRALRLPVAAEAILVMRDGSRPIDLVDISQQGAGYACKVLLEPGSELELVLPGGELRRRALVRWAQANRGGLWFTQPLDRADLESMDRLGAGMAVHGERSRAGAAVSTLGSMLSRVATFGTGRMAKFAGDHRGERSIGRGPAKKEE